MDPSEFIRRYWDAWLSFGRTFTNRGREMPFPPEGEGGHSSGAPEGVEDVNARQFLSVLGRLNGMSEAQAKIVHAWISILLNRMNGYVSDPQGRESASGQRKAALDELLDGYVSYSKEYVGTWNALFANMTNTRQWR
jgi:hypothetical protein